MSNLLRAATTAEIEKIAAESDLSANTIVVAEDTPQGPIQGVIRLCYEVDPVHYPAELNGRWKTVFLRDVSHYLVGKGAPAFYFNIPASEDFAEYREAVTRLGAVQMSLAPELRYKKALL